MSVFTKFIIEDIEGIDHLVIGNCTYHKQLSRDTNNIKGGGYEKMKIRQLSFMEIRMILVEPELMI